MCSCSAAAPWAAAAHAAAASVFLLAYAPVIDRGWAGSTRVARARLLPRWAAAAHAAAAAEPLASGVMAYCVFYLGWAGSTCVAARLLPPWAAAARAAAAAAFSISVMAYAAPLPLLGLLLLRCCCRCSFSIRRDSLLACLLLLARLLALLRVRELCEAEIDLGTLSWSRRRSTFACGCKWLGQRRRRRQAGNTPDRLGRL